MKTTYLIISSLCLALLSACATTQNSSVQVVDESVNQPVNRTNNKSVSNTSTRPNNSSVNTSTNNSAPLTASQYEVSKGDTMYSIGRKFGTDYRKLAEYNQIPEPYTVKVGQVLNIPSQNGNGPVNNQNAANQNTSNTNGAQVVTRPIETPSVNTNTTTNNTANTQGIPTLNQPKSVRDLASTKPKAIVNNTTNNESTPSSDAQTTVTQTPASAANPPAVSKNTPEIDVDTIGDNNIRWIWPTNGRVTSTYNSKTNKGIDIAGIVGQAVYAAGSGKVIYSGTDIRGYGKLVIVKHNKNYLSVYALQGNILVNEGQYVTVGEKIAEMGKDSQYMVKMHFEIRLKGKSVDPKPYLPNR